MKRKLFFICFLSIVCVVSMAQNITKFYFAGYRVVFIPSEEFRIDVKHPELGEKKIKGNALSLKLIDAEGYGHRVYQCYPRDKDGLFGIGHGESAHG